MCFCQPYQNSGNPCSKTTSGPSCGPAFATLSSTPFVATRANCRSSMSSLVHPAAELGQHIDQALTGDLRHILQFNFEMLPGPTRLPLASHDRLGLEEPRLFIEVWKLQFQPIENLLDGEVHEAAHFLPPVQLLGDRFRRQGHAAAGLPKH